MNRLLISQVENIVKDEEKLAALCNVTAILKQEIDRINWIGFYFYKNGYLTLGPFQGKVACTKIDIGKGVCGTSFKRKALINVSDVEKFDGHIACDSASRSELVIPLIYQDKVFGVLDCDSPELNRFTSEEEETLSAIANIVSKKIANI